MNDNVVDAMRQLLDRSGEPPYAGELVRVTLRQPCGRHADVWHGAYGFVQARNTESISDDHPYFVVAPTVGSDWFTAGELAEPTQAERLQLVRRSFALADDRAERPWSQAWLPDVPLPAPRTGGLLAKGKFESRIWLARANRVDFVFRAGAVDHLHRVITVHARF